MTTEEIRELGKKEIGYDRHVALTGEGSALTVLYHWMVGFEKAVAIFSVPEREEEKVDYNANLTSSFIEHCKNEHGIEIPEKAFETFFNA